MTPALIGCPPESSAESATVSLMLARVVAAPLAETATTWKATARLAAPSLPPALAVSVTVPVPTAVTVAFGLPGEAGATASTLWSELLQE